MIIPLAKRADQAQEYYFSVKLAEVRKLIAAGHDVINIGIGNPDMMPSDATIQALTTSAQQPGSHGYQSYKGIPAVSGGYCPDFISIPTALPSTLKLKFCP